MSNMLKITTYNIRCVYDGDGKNAFLHRAGLLWDTVQNEKPDVIGFQEVTTSILKLLKVLLHDYELVGHGREVNYDGEGLYVAVKKDTCTVLSCNTYWIGDNIYQFSCYPNQGCPRIFNSVIIKHNATGKLFRIYNTHLDCTSNVELRSTETKTMLDKITSQRAELALPFIIMGDFNTEPYEEPIFICENYKGAHLTDITKHINHSYHEYGTYNGHSKIDYIFATDEFANSVIDVKPWDRNSSGIYLSDHYPICALFDADKI